MGDGSPREPLALRDFRSYWYADAIGAVGLAITPVVVDVLVVGVLDASETEVGLVRAAQFLPYLLVGLLAGAYVDRWRRRPTLVVTNVAQGVLLLLVPALHLLGLLSVTAVALVLLAAGGCAVFTAAAEQSYLPDLVPRRLLVVANARTGQSATVAQTSGPALGGMLVGVLSAPLALAAGSVSRFAAAALVLRIRRPEPSPGRVGHARLWPSIRQGLGFVYGHTTLAPLAVSTHVWFLANSMALTAFSLLALRDLGLPAAVYGGVLSLAGVGGFVGAVLAPRFGRRVGEGRTIVLCRALCLAAWLAVALTPAGGPTSTAVVVICVAQALYGLSLGLEDPNELGYWQAATPRALLGRVNATRRSANRTAAVLGALLAGALAGGLGYRRTIGLAVVIFLVAVLVAVCSPLRRARTGDLPDAPS
ncbi:MAG TPA: MFS transporter [Phototrophicaceae bacterium]|nr:MFS transporter [Phototrophicaceae bacterium]